MVEDRLDDGVRIARLLASELVAARDPLAVTDADPDVDPTPDGARAYAVRAGAPLATVFVHPDRVRVEFEAEHATVAAAAREAGLRVRPTDTDPPRTLVFVEDGAAVKRARDIFAAAVEAV